MLHPLLKFWKKRSTILLFLLHNHHHQLGLCSYLVTPVVSPEPCGYNFSSPLPPTPRRLISNLEVIGEKFIGRIWLVKSFGIIHIYALQTWWDEVIGGIRVVKITMMVLTYPPLPPSLSLSSNVILLIHWSVAECSACNHNPCNYSKTPPPYPSNPLLPYIINPCPIFRHSDIWRSLNPILLHRSIPPPPNAYIFKGWKICRRRLGRPKMSDTPNTISSGSSK